MNPWVLEDDEKEGKNYLVSALSALIFVIPLTHWIAPELVSIGYEDIWSFHGKGFGDWFAVGWPLLVWGVGLTIVLQLFKRRRWMGDLLTRHVTRADILKMGFIKSVWHGVTEELAFRWLIFFGSFAGLAIGNWFIFGWAGWGLAEWLNTAIVAPFANWTTFGYLEPWLMDKGWLFAAALLATNAFFRNGHLYQGFIGYINSWFAGMFLFYVTFTHGLLAAIFLHFLHNMLVYTVVAVFHD